MLKTETMGGLFTKTTVVIVRENQENMKKVLFERLSNAGIDPITFSQKLKVCGAVLTGSFPLQVILGETWSESDIDIFIQDTDKKNGNKTTFLSYLKSHFNPVDDQSKSKSKSGYINAPSKDPITEEKVKGKKSYQFDKKILDVIDFKTEKSVKIQLIITDKPVNKVIDFFDLDFCKIMYDGEKFSYDNWADIIEKTGKMELRNDLRQNDFFFFKKIFDRYEKYHNRGFKITLSDDLRNELHKITNIIVGGNGIFEKRNYDSIFKLVADHGFDEISVKIGKEYSAPLIETDKNKKQFVVSGPNGKDAFDNLMQKVFIYYMELNQIDSTKNDFSKITSKLEKFAPEWTKKNLGLTE